MDLPRTIYVFAVLTVMAFCGWIGLVYANSKCSDPGYSDSIPDCDIKPSYQ
jgi:hypothetical protein